MTPEIPSNATLLFNISRIFRAITPSLTRTEEDEVRHSYVIFQGYCVLITEALDRLKGLPSDNDHVHRILDFFQSLIDDSLSFGATGPYPRLIALDRHWNKPGQTADARQKCIRSCFNLGSTLSEREAINKAVAKCHDDLVAEFPDDFSWLSNKDFIPQRRWSEPSYMVWAAANTLHKALLASKNCQCHISDNYHTRLCLGTWRQPDNMKFDGDHDFDLFLILEPDWQEIHIQTVNNKEVSRVKFTITSEESVNSICNRPVEGPAKQKKIKEFCQDLKTAKMKSQFRLNLKVENDQLFKLRSDRRQFTIDTSRTPVSLAEFIDHNPDVFTEKNKRVLAVILSYTVLHLHGTPFLEGWGSSSILFLWTNGSFIPIKPYLQSQVTSQQDEESNETCSFQISGYKEDGGIDLDDIDPDDGMPTHQCPSLVTLGMMLLEIYLRESFRLLAKKYDVELGDASNPLDQYIALEGVFQHCKSEIPENSQFYLALNNCLEMNLWEDEKQQPLDEHTLRRKIYSEVVKPLEDELIAAFSLISIDELDSTAQTLDLSSWLQHFAVDGGNAQSHQQAQRAGRPVPPNRSIILRSLSTEAGASSHVQSHDGTPRQADGYRALEFYDNPSYPSPQGSINRYRTWKSNFLKVYDKFVSNHLDDEGPDEPVKIAILDTGIDFSEQKERDWGDKIKRKRNFLSSGDVRDFKDRNGHGTHVAGLICQYAPHAEIYIARVSDETPEDPSIIAKAIDHAVERWNVDIISMSFGYRDRDIEGYSALEKSIEKAHTSHRLLFAAASNSGGNCGRAYPARHEEVICVHSTDSNGNRSHFSPTAMHGHNFATVGESIESAWPSSPTEEGAPDVFKNGTSFATPIAASIGAFLLQFARLHFTAEEAQMLKKSSRMKAVLGAIAKPFPRDGYEYLELSLDGDNFFGKEDLVKPGLLYAMKHSS